MKLDSAKKHSVLYRSEDKSASIQSIYVMKTAFDADNFPEHITIEVSGE
jgi:hypothetical protein